MDTSETQKDENTEAQDTTEENADPETVEEAAEPEGEVMK